MVGCAAQPPKSSSPWTLTKESEAVVTDATLRRQIFEALDAAEKVHTDTFISHFQVRAATVVEVEGKEHVVLGGNTEYGRPEGIHGETSLLNHVMVLYGSEATHHAVRFIAFYGKSCGGVASCGDCRDYQIATTDYEHLLVACGQSSDHTVRVRRFMDQLVCERDFPAVDASRIPLSSRELADLVKSAQQASQNGITLFTPGHNTGVAGLSWSGKVYRAAGADDAAFHYRYPVGGMLQQAATERDYLMRAVVVAGNQPGEWPAISYRDRQYGYEVSTFNHAEGKPPIALILTDGRGNFKATTFESALPNAFSTAAFMPDALSAFLKSHSAAK
jgi:DNA-binding beta-propeller fold protein YncE